MEKKAKNHLTNEEITGKFKSSFELVNYAIKLAENMIKTGREARVKSEVQNRAMLVVAEIHEGKDQLDEIKVSTSSTPHFNGIDSHVVEHGERSEKRKYRTAETYSGEA